MLADRFDGMRLNSPNDVVAKSDGSIWFTDPSYGIDSEYEGDAAPSEIGASNVYRIDPETGAVTLVIDDLVQPNGLAFSPDESLLYVADTGRTHRPEHDAKIRAYPISLDRTGVHDGHDFAICDAGLFDGFRVDTARPRLDLGRRRRALLRPRRHAARQDPDPRGRRQRLLRRPKRNRLFICATTSVFALYVNARGCGL